MRCLNPRRLFLTAFISLALLAPAFGGNDPVAKVRMTLDKKFLPATVTIKAGEWVEWVAEDPLHQHSITTDPSQVENRRLVQIPPGAKPFTSPLLDPGKTYRVRFTVPGTYKYVCPPHEHSNMVGEVIVTP